MQTTARQNDRSGPLSLVTKWWRDWKRQRAAIDELNCCGPAELARVARDVSLTPSELRTLAGKWPGSASLLPLRIGSLGFDTEQIRRAEPQVMRDLERVCAQCTSKTRCEHDLDRNDKDRVWRDYCPNVATLDALRSEDRDRRLLRRRRTWRSV
jgi:Family of unknown function (DUF6455)